MRKKLIYLTLALAALAAAQAGIAPVSAAPPGCETYCCPNDPGRCVTCCPNKPCPRLYCP
jgi:hypothetical protein